MPRSEWKVELEDARRMLRDRYGSADDVAPLRQGLWSSAYGFRVGSDELVIRFGSIRDDFDKDAWIAERAPARLPAPRILEIGEALGGYYAVSRRLHGRHLDDLTADEMQRVLPSLLEALDAVREIDLRGTTGYGLWEDGRGEEASWRDELLGFMKEDPARDPRWRERLAASLEASSAVERGLGRVRELLDAMADERYVVHSDLLHYNVLVADDRVTAVLDWGSSIFGDFVYDVAWLTFWQPWYPRWSGIDFAHAARDHYGASGLDVQRFSERLRCCELRIGLGSLVWYSSRNDAVNLGRAARRIEDLVRSE